MKRWMISLAPNRRTKFVSFTSRLVGKRHSTGARSSSLLPQRTLFCPDLCPAPGLGPLPKPNPIPGLPLRFHHRYSLVSGPGPDLAPLQPGLGCTSTLPPTQAAHGWRCGGDVHPAPFPTAMLPWSLWLGHPLASTGFLTRSELTVLHPPKPCCPAAGSVPVHPSLSPCSLADCPQIQCVHPYVAQQPDELSLELADILNILDKTDDGTGDGMGLGRESLWKGGLCSRQAAAEQEGRSGQGETPASASQPRELTAGGGSYCLLLTLSKSRLP